jgi:hypothetical protein
MCLKCSIHSYDRRKILSSVGLFKKKTLIFFFDDGEEFHAYFALYKETVSAKCLETVLQLQ